MACLMAGEPLSAGNAWQSGGPRPAHEPRRAEPSALCSCRGLGGQQLGHPEQVVGGGHEIGPQSSAGDAAVAGLAQSADHFCPADDLLDLLPTALAQLVAGGTERAPIE